MNGCHWVNREMVFEITQCNDHPYSQLKVERVYCPYISNVKLEML